MLVKRLVRVGSVLMWMSSIATIVSPFSYIGSGRARARPRFGFYAKTAHVLHRHPDAQASHLVTDGSEVDAACGAVCN
jgi:hypothetical protein